MRYKGKLITFEGGEGSGKSSQAAMLKDYLFSKGYKTVLTRDPGGTEISEKIRKFVLNSHGKKWNKDTETLLFSAARSELCKDFIWPHLKEGYVVISDRFYDSTVAYQGYGFDLDEKDINFIKSLNRYASKGMVPDLTFLLDIDPELGLKKSSKKEFKEKDNIEKRDLKYHKKVRRGFLELVKEEPWRIKVIDYLEGNALEMHKKVIKHVDMLLK